MAKELKAHEEDCIRLHECEGRTMTEAYRATHKIGNWKPETVNNKAHAFFKRDEIQARLAEIREASREKTEIDHAYMIQRFHELESFDFLDIMDERGAMRPLHEWPESARRTIVAYECYEEYHGKGEERAAVGMVKKIKLENRSKALESLAKHLKFYPDPRFTLDVDGETLTFLEKVQNTAHGSPQGWIGANHVN